MTRLLAICILFLACQPPDVPVEHYGCAPEAAAVVLWHYGFNVAESTLARAMGTSAGSTSIWNIAPGIAACAPVQAQLILDETKLAEALGCGPVVVGLIGHCQAESTWCQCLWFVAVKPFSGERGNDDRP